MQTTHSNSALEARLMEKEANVKSPGFAAVLGLFFPTLGSLYVRKYFQAFVLMCIEVACIILAFIGIGLVLMFLVRLVTAYLCYKTADQLNTLSLRKRYERLHVASSATAPLSSTEG